MPERQFVTFELAGSLYGVDIVRVREIIRNLDIADVDRAPSYVRGLLNLRGQIVTTIDLAERLGLPNREQTRESSCIVLKTAVELERRGINSEGALADLAGLFVDKIGDVVSVDEQALEPPAAHAGGVSRRYLEAVAKLDGRLLVVLSLTEVLALEAERV